jgi:hypothetical protein
MVIADTMATTALANVTLAAIALAACLGIRSDTLPLAKSRMGALPRWTLWTWERREDLRSIDTKRFGVAFLDKTVSIGATVHSQPRRDPLIFPAAAARMPVIRIETTRESRLDEANRADAVRAVLASAQEPGVSAVQIDFDATRSERLFYRSLIFDVRRQMPSGMPLSITALASWCSFDDWLGDLPVDEAVPMFFRMEPDRRRAGPNVDDFRIREPLCQTSVGVSTTEPWPSDLAGKRIYVFADNGWRRDSPADLERVLQGRTR